MYLLGFDIGSSSVKGTLISVADGKCVASAFYPKTEMEITAIKTGWAEQNPLVWWENLKSVTKEILSTTKIEPSTIKGIGISYQMHGLVIVDKNQKVLRPSIIWCDSRAVSIGDKAFTDLSTNTCLEHLLNSPGNFTASKLSWVKNNEPQIYKQIYKAMLPGDYIAMKLTNTINTTVSGLSEGMFWDFKTNAIASFLLDYYGIDQSLLPTQVQTFSVQGEVSKEAAAELGLAAGTPIAYRGGDQPNNALSLNVLNPGEIAATAGTSGVVYGVSDKIQYDRLSRVNTFAHINNTKEQSRLGILLCVNGTGILNSWMKKNIGENLSYDELNGLANKIAIGSEGLSVLPFGNGSERMLGNKNIGSSISGLNFNIHNKNHLLRAGQEGIAFSFNYGMEIMKAMGINLSVIRAGNANMFLSNLFRESLAGVTGATIELYNTDGSEGAARGAGVGTGIYKSFKEAFSGLKKIKVVEPDKAKAPAYKDAYMNWNLALEKELKQ
jgi:xylulokinase